MSLEDDIRWFKQQFIDSIQIHVRDTPFTVDLLTAIALQETGIVIWTHLYKTMPVSEVLKLCVGDTIDGSGGRGEFPTSKSDLLRVRDGNKMFSIARDALVLMAKHIPSYGSSVKNPNKFCHGFGVFQRDLQHFRNDPNYFLEKRWYNFENCLNLAIKNLKEAQNGIPSYRHKTTLTDKEMVYVAIAYNTGSAILTRGFKQGFKDSSGTFYGEYIWGYLQKSKSVTVGVKPISHDTQKHSPVASVSDRQVGEQYRVIARNGLHLREGHGTQFGIIGNLHLGQIVFVASITDGWAQVDVEGDGHIDGFVSAGFLERVSPFSVTSSAIKSVNSDQGLLPSNQPIHESDIEVTPSKASMFSLQGSVGNKGENHAEDVIKVKQHLHDLGFDWLKPGSQVDPGLIQAINLFQSIINGKTAVRGDGIIDVGGKTHQWLQASNAPHWILMPIEGKGFINYERKDNDDHHDYGTSWLSDAIVAAGKHYEENYRRGNPSISPIPINDVSLIHGGDTPEHHGHECGNACDIYLPRKGGGHGLLTWENSNYDRNAARAIIQALRAQSIVPKNRIFFNDTTLIREGLCQRLEGHHHHIHFEVGVPIRS